ncbi:MAG: hypothetical protein M1447_08835 [Gammaproteobacteria bacterium]|jgi:hypothetical protein|nr:hypothetical protein [Gammaproteobacteria bacterium]
MSWSVWFTNATLDDAGIENNFLPLSLLALNAGPGATNAGSEEYLFIKEVAAATPAASLFDDVDFEDELDELPHAAATKPRLATTNPIRIIGCFNASPFLSPQEQGIFA